MFLWRFVLQFGPVQADSLRPFPRRDALGGHRGRAGGHECAENWGGVHFLQTTTPRVSRKSCPAMAGLGTIVFQWRMQKGHMGALSFSFLLTIPAPPYPLSRTWGTGRHCLAASLEAAKPQGNRGRMC